MEPTSEPSPPATATATAPLSRWGRLRRRLIRLVLILAVFALVLIPAHRPLLVGFAYLFRVDDPAPSDALVLLQGGLDHRPARAAQLYREGVGPVILMGETGVTPVLEVNEGEKIREYLVRNGVPPDAIRILPGGVVESTADEAMRVREYARSHPLRRVTLVTTSFHTARARQTFRRFLRGVDIRVAAVRRLQYSESDWYRNERGLLDYFEETIKVVRDWILHGIGRA